ncbi:MAG: hypothetical protein HQL50_04065 [Magnetococcales bacterium]|nr:hypothetical protein [Magnetococcales bacterium]
MIEIVNNQLRDNDPFEVKETYDRLCGSGYSDNEARTLIARALASEMFMVLKHQEPFDLNRYAAMLRQLPRVTG